MTEPITPAATPDPSAQQPATTAPAPAPAAPAQPPTSEAALKLYADVELGALTPEQQEIVKAAAGDNPAEQLRAIAILKAVSRQKAPEPPPAPIPAPAQTAPAAAAPPPASVTATPDVKEEYSRLRASNPLLAAAYLMARQDEYLNKISR